MVEPSEFVLDTNASLHGMGRLLYQRIDLLLDSAELLSHVPEIAGSTVMIKHFRHYFLGQHVELQTGHTSECQVQV